MFAFYVEQFRNGKAGPRILSGDAGTAVLSTTVEITTIPPEVFGLD
jgi:hypothetical protein